MTRYRERREAGFYSPTGETTKPITTQDLAGLGAPQEVTPKSKPKAEPSARKK